MESCLRVLVPTLVWCSGHEVGAAYLWCTSGTVGAEVPRGERIKIHKLLK
jgi:hypothetical protein